MLNKKSKIKILCTLGPSSLNEVFLKFSKKNVSLLRLNMSHTRLNNLEKQIKFIKKYTNTPICIDTEGAQIRTTKTSGKIKIKKNQKVILEYNNCKSNKSKICLYPKTNFLNFKKGSKIYIGFEELVLKIEKIYQNKLIAKVIEEGFLESNKGVHFQDNIKLQSLTNKDIKAISIAKKYNIKYFALSFANSNKDITTIKKLLNKNDFLISKIETKQGFINRKEIIKNSDAVLIDRGDLSRYVKIQKIPIAQRIILDSAKKNKKDVFIATNLLESMIEKKNPTRAESNDIYFSLLSGAKGLVLAAESAIGKYPIESVNFLKEMIELFKLNKINKVKETYLFN